MGAHQLRLVLAESVACPDRVLGGLLLFPLPRRNGRRGNLVSVTEDALRVVQLNVDSLVSPRWPERRLEVVKWLDELNADVVCLQEVWQDDRHPNTGGWIAERAAVTWFWEFGGFAPPDPDSVGPTRRSDSAPRSSVDGRSTRSTC